jgi:hypothetical protein
VTGVVTYYSYDLLTLTLLAELPYTGVGFSQRLNSTGSFSGALLLSDPKVQSLGPVGATNPSKTLTIIDLDGQIVWGGPNWTRSFDSTSSVLSIGGQEAWTYLGHRLQAMDYTKPAPGAHYWSANPADACSIAAQLVYDALINPATRSLFAGSAFQSLTIAITETIPNHNGITVSYPSTQRQAIDQIITTLSASGYETGFDFGIDWSWSAGQGSKPVPVLNLSYPRRGMKAGPTSPVILTGGDASVSYIWPEDGTKQTNSDYGTASGSGALAAHAADNAVLRGGYPLLESFTSWANVNTKSQLATIVDGDLAQREWPIVTPQFTMPMMGDPALGAFRLGDDERVIITPDERFPSGADSFLRVTGLDVQVVENGLSTMTHTMNTPPGLAPVPAPPN